MLTDRIYQTVATGVMNLQKELLVVLSEIEKCMKEYRDRAVVPENVWIDTSYHNLLIAKSNVLIALQKYEI